MRSLQIKLCFRRMISGGNRKIKEKKIALLGHLRFGRQCYLRLVVRSPRCCCFRSFPVFALAWKAAWHSGVKGTWHMKLEILCYGLAFVLT